MSRKSIEAIGTDTSGKWSREKIEVGEAPGLAPNAVRSGRAAAKWRKVLGLGIVKIDEEERGDIEGVRGAFRGVIICKNRKVADSAFCECRKVCEHLSIMSNGCVVSTCHKALSARRCSQQKGVGMMRSSGNIQEHQERKISCLSPLYPPQPSARC